MVLGIAHSWKWDIPEIETAVHNASVFAFSFKPWPTNGEHGILLLMILDKY